MTDIKISEQPRILNELAQALGQAIGGASQLIHLRYDPRWMIIREALELAKEGIMAKASFDAAKVIAVNKR